MQAKIHERGNGFPDSGDYVSGPDGSLYLITGESFGPIQTGDHLGNWLAAEVEEATWTDAGAEFVFPALCIPIQAEADR